MSRGAGAFAVAALLHWTVCATAAPVPAQPPAKGDVGARSGPQSIGPDGLTDDEVRRVLRTLQRGLRADDAALVSSVVVFPLRVNTAKGPRLIQGPRALSAEYDAIFTPPIRDAILEQEPGTLMRSYRGAMIGNGEAWISGVCNNTVCAKYRVGLVAIGPPR